MAEYATKSIHKWPSFSCEIGLANSIYHKLKDGPIFLKVILDKSDIASPFREACFYELAEQIAPGLVKDVHVMEGIAASQGNVVFQIKKRRPRDEGIQREIITASLALSPVLQLAIAVDEDVDIYSPHDLLWAIITRCDMGKGIIKGPVRSSAYLGAYPSNSGIGIDATVSWDDKGLFERAHYPSDEIDLKRWIPEDRIAAAKAIQSEYAKILAKTGH